MTPADHDPSSHLTPLPGGWSGRTFLGEVAGEQSVVRIYPPDLGGHTPETDAALLRLVRGLVPVPEVLEVRPAAAGAPGLLITEVLPGRRGDEVLADLLAADDADGLTELGRAMGEVAGTLAGMPFLTPGAFADGELQVTPWPDADLPAWIEEHSGILEFVLGAAGFSALLDLAHARSAGGDPAPRVCLVHSDLNPKNVLVDPDTRTLTGVVDWEFAHAGHPHTDLGNVVRFDRHPAYLDAAVSAYVERRGGTAAEALAAARWADLWALVDLAARAGQNPVADRAASLLRAIAEAGDVHAPPPR